MPLVSRYSAWIKMVLRSKRPWNQLSTDEQSALAPKLAGLENATAADAFNKVINAGASDAIRVTASVQTVKCYIAQSGGLENSETWQQIKEITEVNSNGGYPRGADMGEIIGNAVDPFENQTSCIQVRVNDKDEFLKALANDPKNAFQVDSLGDEAMKTIGASWHPFNNARAATDYRSDPQMHYSNDWSDRKAADHN